MLVRLVDEITFRMSEDELRRTSLYGDVGVYYAFENYGHSVQHVLELRDEVLKDFPEMKDSDMDIRELSKSETDKHASYTTLYISIPIDDYLKLRAKGNFDIK